MKMIFVLLSFCASVAIAKTDCPTVLKSFDEEFKATSAASEDLKDSKRWQKIGNFAMKFGPCLDASYAETTGAMVDSALSKDWDAFLAYVKKSKPSKATLNAITKVSFAWEINTEEAKQIQQNAKKSCPAALKDFCTMVRSTKIE